MKLFIGPDVSLEKTAICVISEHGKIVREAQVSSEPEALLLWIGDQDREAAAIGLEAGPLPQWLHRGLSAAELPVVLMETRQVKGALKAMPDQDGPPGCRRDRTPAEPRLVPTGSLQINLCTRGSRCAHRSQGGAARVHHA